MPSLGDGQDIAAVALYTGIKRSTLMKVDSQHLRILGRYAPKQVQITIISNCTSKSACNTQCRYMDGIFENARSRGLDEYSFLFRDRQRPNYHRRDQNRHRESFNYHNNNNNNNSSPSILQGVESRTEVLLSLHLKIIHVSVWHYQGWLNEKGNSFRGERIVF